MPYICIAIKGRMAERLGSALQKLLQRFESASDLCTSHFHKKWLVFFRYIIKLAMKKILIFGFLLLISCSTKQNIALNFGGTPRPKNIILMIGDGMGTAQVYAGLVTKGYLNLEQFKCIGFHKTYSATDFITDSSAGATAFSTGKKTYNLAVGVGLDSLPLPTILEAAEAHGLATGMVVTCNLAHATPASFIAHQPMRYMYPQIAADYLKTDIDVMIGGGKGYFDKRTDGRNLVTELQQKGYAVLDSSQNLEGFQGNKLAYFYADYEPKKMSEGRGDILKRGTQKAMQILSKNRNGFFMMVEGSQIDWGGHSNETDYITNEMMDFDDAIGAALDFAKKDGNTLVIVTADHETGGFALVNGSIQEKKVYGQFVTKRHTGVMVPVFAYGVGAEAFMGIYENTEIYVKMKTLFGF